MATTFRSILYNVLVNIGEGANASNLLLANNPAGSYALTDNYQIQVANFVNHIKEEVEDAWNWSALYGTFNLAWLANNAQQQIIDGTTNAYALSRCRTVRSRQKEYGREVALCFDTTSFATPFALAEIEGGLNAMIYYNQVLAQAPIAYSPYFALQDTGNDVVNMIVGPPANQNRTIQITLCNPQTRIDPTVAGNATYPWLGTVGLDTPILVPAKAIEMGASWYALEERGEELGASSVFTEERYRDALDDSISRDVGQTGDIIMLVS
jgi:hypothetical protein